MGQKVNPTIYRLGITKNWKTKYSEKNSEEFANNNIKSLEIYKFLRKNLERNQALLQDYRINYNKSELDVYVSWVLNSDNILKKQNKIILKEGTNFLIMDKLKLLKKKIEKNKTNLKNDFCFKTSKSLHCYIKNVKKVNLYSYCLNKDFFVGEAEKPTFKRHVMSLQRYKKSFFFKEGLKLVLALYKSKSFCDSLSDYVIKMLKKSGKNRQRRFIYFLKKLLKILLNKNSNIIGLKLKIKGRINGRPRAKHMIINIGEPPINSLKFNLKYTEKVFHNVNGSYSVKIWIVEK